MGALSERRKLKTHSTATRLCSRDVVVNGLRFFWVITIIWGEVGTFFYSLRSCRWPSVQPFQVNEKPAHILLITDAQVHLPSSPGERSWRRSLRRYIYNRNLKKSWNVASRLKPHSVIFLGDMLASGKYVTNKAEYRQYYNKFKDMLPLDPATKVWYLPGNNDVGLGLSRVISKTIRRHFSDTFGPFNLNVSMKNHTLLLLDAPGLVEEDYQRAAHGKQYDGWEPIRGGAVEFVKTNAAARSEKPLILFSHIPLFRPDTKTCGPLRERGTIRRGVGTGYQNTLGKQTSAFLIESLRPSAIFSGDNRDYCDYTHNIASSNPESDEKYVVREVTVKSFSMANQIRRPGFQLFSLVSPPVAPAPVSQTFADAPCFLPDQYGIYTSVYAPLLAISFFLLFVLNIYHIRHLRASPITPISLSPSTSRSNNTPLLHPDSAIWSPHTPLVSPIARKSNSPRSSAFPALRTPNTPAAPTLRALSRPSTPHGSPLLSPIIVPHDDEDEESMYPAQYAVRRDAQHQPNGNASWLAENRHDNRDADYGDYGRSSSYFLPAPRMGGADQQALSWSWSVIVRGRRLHMTIRYPKFLTPRSLKAFFSPDAGDGLRRKRWSVLRGTGIDLLGVAWPTIIVWVVIARWIF